MKDTEKVLYNSAAEMALGKADIRAHAKDSDACFSDAGLEACGGLRSVGDGHMQRPSAIA